MAYYEFIVQIYVPDDKSAIQYYEDLKKRNSSISSNFSVLWKIDRKVVKHS